MEIKNKHRKYTIEFKLKVLKLLDNNVSIHKISDKLKIDRKNIRDWRDKRVALNNVQNKDKAFRCNRKTGLKKILLMKKNLKFPIGLLIAEKITAQYQPKA